MLTGAPTPAPQLFNHYAPHPNAVLLLHYGFALEDNPDDLLLLPLSLPTAPKSSLSKERLLAAAASGLPADVVKKHAADAGVGASTVSVTLRASLLVGGAKMPLSASDARKLAVLGRVAALSGSEAKHAWRAVEEGTGALAAMEEVEAGRCPACARGGGNAVRQVSASLLAWADGLLSDEPEPPPESQTDAVSPRRRAALIAWRGERRLLEALRRRHRPPHANLDTNWHTRQPLPPSALVA